MQSSPTLGHIPFFSELDPEELRSLLSRVQQRSYRADEPIFRDGDPPAFVYYIVEGEVNVSLTSQDRRISVGKLGAGDVLGILAIFDEGPQFLSATALMPSTVLALPKEDVLAMLRRHPETLVRIVSTVTKQIRAAAVLIADMQFLDLPVRLAKRLLSLADGAAAGATGEPITVRVTQEALAELVGATRGGVNRALKRLEHLGMIRTGRGRVIVLAADRLRRLTEEETLPMILGLTQLTSR